MTKARSFPADWWPGPSNHQACHLALVVLEQE
jgi:hypothetical protein